MKFPLSSQLQVRIRLTFAILPKLLSGAGAAFLLGLGPQHKAVSVRAEATPGDDVPAAIFGAYFRRVAREELCVGAINWLVKDESLWLMKSQA